MLHIDLLFHGIQKSGDMGLPLSGPHFPSRPFLNIAIQGQAPEHNPAPPEPAERPTANFPPASGYARSASGNGRKNQRRAQAKCQDPIQTRISHWIAVGLQMGSHVRYRPD
jgi:hypothetical protein